MGESDISSCRSGDLRPLGNRWPYFLLIGDILSYVRIDSIYAGTDPLCSPGQSYLQRSVEIGFGSMRILTDGRWCRCVCGSRHIYATQSIRIKRNTAGYNVDRMYEIHLLLLRRKR